MRVEFLRAMDSDFEEVVDFANYVFSHSGEKTDFPSLLSKLYKKEYNTMKDHYIVKEDGKIKAVVGAFPMELEILGNSLKVAGIGTVSVHPYSRGSGYMKSLMNMALEDMKKQGVHLSCLGGMRQRYEYFGYTPCGQKVYFTINKENVRHKLSEYINENISFSEVKESDIEVINKAYEIYNKSNYKFLREKSMFFDILKSWNFKVYSIMKSGTFIGYMTVTPDKKYVSELVVKDEEFFLEAIANYIKSSGIDEINIELPVWEKKKIRSLYEFAEENIINNSYQFNIINYEEVLKKLLEFKNSYSNLNDGTLIVEIKEYGTIKVSIKEGNIEVVKSDEKSDIVVNHLKAMQIFFSPLGGYLLDNDTINSWFPLPLYIPTQDKV